MWVSEKWLVLWSLWAARLIPQRTPPLRVTNGWLRGVVSPSGSHAAYLNIPYASVTHRFKAPGPEPTWSGVFDAVNENTVCRQAFTLDSKYTVGQENCLVLNVYTPLNKQPKELLPVMVFIHGGGFFQRSGSPAIFGAEYLSKKGVILVTLNYRLNIQGFLCLRTKEAPGNAGMKDQVAALKWIQRNILAFGGDPDNVTIFGESAGAASVSYHVLSPMSKGLFHKAITQSGSSLCNWAYQYKPVYLASLLAKTMGLESQDPKELYDFFMTKSDIDLIVTRVPRQVGNNIISEILFSPCAETRIDGEEPFLTESPYDILSNGNYNKVPMIIGSNNEEGLLFVEIEKDVYLQNMTFEGSMPKNLYFPNDVERKDVAEKAKRMYMGDDEIEDATRHKLSKMHGEPMFNYQTVKEAELIMNTGENSVYYYLFGYDGRRNILKAITRSSLKRVAGATHADELFYMFSQYLLPSLYENAMIDLMTTMWTNFAKFGNPTPDDSIHIKWPSLTKESKKALFIDTNLHTIPLWYSDSLKFWDQVYAKYRRRL